MKKGANGENKICMFSPRLTIISMNKIQGQRN